MVEMSYSVVTGDGVKVLNFDVPQEFKTWLDHLQEDYARLVEML